MIKPTVNPIAIPHLENAKMESAQLITMLDSNEALFEAKWSFNISKVEVPSVLRKVSFEMLKEGTSSKNNAQLAAAIENTGGRIIFNASSDFLDIHMDGLSEEFNHLQDLLLEMMQHSVLPEDRMNWLIQRGKSSWTQTLQKTDTRARRLMMKHLFPNHAYGEVSQLEDYDQITTTKIAAFLKETWKQSNHYMLSGNVGNLDSVKNIIQQYSGTLQKNNSLNIQNEAGIYKDELSSAMQSSLKLAITIPSYPHPDHFKVRMMSMLFGGYFGARLMQNLREDKGFTYGISSGVVNKMDASYLMISGDVLGNATHASLEEIEKEMVAMQQEPVSPHELQLAKNYYLGQITKSLDGIYEQADWNFTFLKKGLTMDYFHERMRVIEQITAEEIQEMAQKYLNFNQWTVAISGNPKDLNF